MTSSATTCVLWVTREGAEPVGDAVLRERAGVEDPDVEVLTRTLGTWSMATIPAGSRDEWGTVFHVVLNVGPNELPPEGRVFVVAPA